MMWINAFDRVMRVLQHLGWLRTATLMAHGHRCIMVGQASASAPTDHDNDRFGVGWDPDAIR